MTRILIFIALFSLTYSASFGQILESIEFEGTTKTKDAYLFALIDSKVGDQFDTTKLNNDLQTLKNLNLFLIN